jgi:hypothetical protein
MLGGIVTDVGGTPVAGAEVELDGRRPVITSLDGRFGVTGVRRGPHSIRARKPGHEPATVEVDFVDRRQIIYIRLVSRDALIRSAVTAIEAGRLGRAERFLERAAPLTDSQTDPDVRLLEAVLLAEAGDRNGALEALAPLLDDPQSRAAAKRLAAAIRDAASRSR